MASVSVASLSCTGRTSKVRYTSGPTIMNSTLEVAKKAVWKGAGVGGRGSPYGAQRGMEKRPHSPHLVPPSLYNGCCAAVVGSALVRRLLPLIQSWLPRSANPVGINHTINHTIILQESIHAVLVICTRGPWATAWARETDDVMML